MSTEEAQCALREVSPDPEVRERSLAKAQVLMRMALPLLDVAGDALAAARLQHAVEAIGSRTLVGPPLANA